MRIRPALLAFLLLLLAARLIAVSTASNRISLAGHGAHRGAGTPHVMQNSSGPEFQRTQTGLSSARKLPVIVDGALTPGAVPNVIAERVFIRSLAQTARRDAVLMRLKLPDADRTAVLSALGAAPERIVEIADQRKSLARSTNSEAIAARIALKAEEDQLLDATYARVLSGLTSGGVTKVSQYVQTHVKSRLKGFSVAAAMHH